MRRLFAVAVAAAFTSSGAPGQTHSKQPLQRIAFGSCNREYKPQPLWKQIMATRPDVWVWLGDIVYGEADELADLARRYETLKAQPDYTALRQQTKVLGIWDDHDYGTSNGGSDNPYKRDVQKVLLDFLDEPAASPRRTQEGVYASYIFGPPGRQTKIILLDVRFHREPRSVLHELLGLTTVGEADILGTEQWRWLEAQLTASTADVHLIASGTQVIACEHGREKWSDYPKARQRLFNLLAKTRPRNLIFLTGDRHLAEISRMTDDRMPQPIFDITASGMTHHAEDRWYRKFSTERNRFRLGANFLGLNFGLIEINWDASPPSAALQIRDVNNAIVREEKITLAPQNL